MGKNATGIKATGQDLLRHLIADFLGKGGSSSEFKTFDDCSLLYGKNKNT